MSMRVIFNVDAITAPLTGIGRYALELARGLARSDAIDALRLYSAYRWVDDAEHALAANRTIAAVRRNVPFKSVALELYTQARAALFRLHTRRMQDWILHTPNYVLMPFDGVSLTTVHDLSWLAHPETHPPERVRFLERHLPRSLEQASLVLTDSAFVAREIVAKLGVPNEKVRVVALGVDAAYRPRQAGEIAATLRQYGLDGTRYLLAVATQEPRKNLVRLACAYAQLPKPLREQHPLVIVGARGWLQGDIERVLAPLEARGDVRRLGYVDDSDLPRLYAGAHAFAFVSLYEGFGLPVLEAMASGVPVLTSAASAMSELAADAAGPIATLVDPLDDEAIRIGLARLLGDDAWRADAAARGLQRAATLPWSHCVADTIGVYRELQTPSN